MCEGTFEGEKSAFLLWIGSTIASIYQGYQLLLTEYAVHCASIFTRKGILNLFLYLNNPYSSVSSH
jgi:hypothetical protein